LFFRKIRHFLEKKRKLNGLDILALHQSSTMQDWAQDFVEKFALETDPYKRISFFIKIGIRHSEDPGVLVKLNEMLTLMRQQSYPTQRENLLNRAWLEYAKCLNMFFLPDEQGKSQTQGPAIMEQNLLTLRLFEELDEKKGQAETLINIALINWSRGEYKEAFEQAFKAASLAQETQVLEVCARIYYNLGNFHFDTHDIVGAQKYYQLSLENAENSGSELFVLARSLVGLGNIAATNQDFEKARQYLLKAIDIQESYGDKWGKSRSLNDLGNIARKLKDYPAAKQYLNESIQVRRKQPNQQGYITSLLDLAELYLELGEATVARRYANLALKVAQLTDSKPKVARAFLLKSKSAQMSGEYKLALEFFQEFYQIKEAILGTEQSLKLKEIENRFLLEMRDKEAEIERLKTVELKEAYDNIERKNRDITASITYAKRIQDAILPTAEEMQALIPHFFVLYLPRDIVSGDLYWVKSVGTKTIVAAVDCTGHGVPGAFMSLIASDLLSTIVLERKTTEPAEILSQLRKEVYFELRQSQNQNRDGMDLSIATYDSAQNRLVVGSSRTYFAYYHQDQLHQIKGDNIVIGGEIEGNAVFSQMEIEPSSTLYLFSDGMADQFGGKAQRKLMLKGMREILSQAAVLPLKKQKNYIEERFLEWQGHNKQIDDVMVLGLRFQQ
jgi:serine phosphatase RsbU (regulator of sigma subunit)